MNNDRSLKLEPCRAPLCRRLPRLTKGESQVSRLYGCVQILAVEIGLKLVSSGPKSRPM